MTHTEYEISVILEIVVDFSFPIKSLTNIRGSCPKMAIIYFKKALEVRNPIIWLVNFKVPRRNRYF